MTTDFPTAPGAYGLNGPSAPVTVEKSPHASHTEILTPLFSEQRIKQSFFRRAVLSGYRERCCMSGLSDPRLLIASHIVPWSRDKANRLNPSNGLCLSAIHDRAFDKGLITLSDDYRVILAKELRGRKEAFVEQVFIPLEGRKIELPERFWPDQSFISQHRSSVFVDR